MQVPVEIHFHHVESREDIETLIHQKVDKLNELCPELVRCRVVVDAPHQRHQTGNLFQVRIELHIPGKDIVVTHQQHDDELREDLGAALRKAFDQARRRLRSVRERRQEQNPAVDGQVPVFGRVVRVERDKGYGYLETIDGREVYFERGAVLDGRFDNMKPGSEVRFAEHVEGKAPRASTILLIQEPR